jgi:hypothetical protein
MTDAAYFRAKMTPSDWAALGDAYDCTDYIGPSGPTPVMTEEPWPMYSFERPSYILWNAIAAGLHARGWSDDKIKEWLQSKATRWALDGTLGETLTNIGRLYAEQIELEDRT